MGSNNRCVCHMLKGDGENKTGIAFGRTRESRERKRKRDSDRVRVGETNRIKLGYIEDSGWHLVFTRHRCC